MRKIWFIPFLTVVVAVLFASCQKEVSGDGILPSPDDNPLLGTWKLVNNDVNSEVSQELSDDIGTISNISSLDYITINNKGSLTFEKDKILAKQISFDVADTIKSEIYVNGFFVEAFDTPINASFPSSTSSTNYMLIGKDSIYCPNGSFLQVEGADSSETVPAGFRFVIQDNRLILTNQTNEEDESVEDGITTKTKSQVTIVTTLEKQ